jgi:ubiquinone/menaquinone biosynthesis C-methylase UbiE
MTEAINQRYSKLSQTECCLSCGGAAGYCEPRPGQTCVDLGSGQGTDVLRLAAEVGPSGTVYGVDVADGMLEKARRAAEKLGVTNARFVKSELESLALPDQTADWLISNCTLNHAGDKNQVWREIFRVLKKGGRFVVSDIYAVDEIAEEFRNDPEAVAECWAGAIRREEYLRCIEEAGLTRVRILEESAPYEKGKTRVASFTIAGVRPAGCCCCS